jgi:hypothetical protein
VLGLRQQSPAAAQIRLDALVLGDVERHACQPRDGSPGPADRIERAVVMRCTERDLRAPALPVHQHGPLELTDVPRHLDREQFLVCPADHVGV